MKKSMKKLNMSLIIGICLGVALLLITGVILMKGYSDTQAASKAMMQPAYQVPSYGNAAGKTPDASLGTQGNTMAPSSTSQSYMNDLNQTKDDGGTSDLQSIDTASQGL